MSTNNDPDRDQPTPVGPDPSERRAEQPAPEQPVARQPVVEEIVVAEPSSVEPGTLEPVVARVVHEPARETGSDERGWARPAETRPVESTEQNDPNPYVVRTTVPPMNPHITGSPVTPQGSGTAPAPAPAPHTAPGIPGGEIYSAAPMPVYSAPPAPPAAKGNRLAGIVIALLGTVAFAVVYAAVASLFFFLNPAVDNAVGTLVRFLVNFAFIIPVVFFAIAFILLVLILNRAGWWAYIIGGFFVAAVVYAGSIVGAYLSVQGWTMSQGDLGDFLRSLLMDPLPITAAIVAREVSVWTGAWVASRGRKVKARNQAARADYDKTLAEAPATAPSGQPVW